MTRPLEPDTWPPHPYPSHPQATPESPPPPLPALDAPHCADCGYSLAGLPGAGNCPECGAAYDPRQIVAYGWAVGPKARVQNMRVGTIIALGCGVLYFTAYLGFILIAFLGTVAVTIMGCLLSAVALYLIYAIYRRRQIMSERPAPFQLRMCMEGFAVRDGYGPVTLTKWKPSTQMSIYAWGKNSFRVLIKEADIGAPVVQLDFDGSEADAQRFRQRVFAWRDKTPAC